MNRVAVIALLVALAPAVVGAPSPYERGQAVEVKGTFSGAVFTADEVVLADEASLSIKGPIGAYDPQSRTLRFGSLVLSIDDETRIQSEDGANADDTALAAGRRVKVSLRRRDDGSLRVRRVRLLRTSASRRLVLEGPIESILPGRENVASFVLLDTEIIATTNTVWQGIDRPGGEVDDEDIRPAKGLIVGRFGRLAGEVRADYKNETNFDLFDDFDGDLASRRLRARIEWIFPATRRMSGMLQLKAESEEEITDDADDFEPGDDFTLGRAYLLFRGVIGKHGSVQVGRSRFDDPRDWLYNRDIDAVRLFFDFEKWRFEASLGEEIVDPTNRHRDVTNHHLAASWYPAKRHEITLYLLDRDDDFIRPNGNPRDFSPRLVGLRANGRRKHRWGYWLEAARARGSDGGTRLDGEALDIGGTWVFRGRLEPSITLGYAYGSGDDDSGDDIDRTFRQSGLHLNNGKWNGVSSFRYYGELTRPELANLHITTIGFGLRPAGETSIDLVYHRYELDHPASELVDADVDDRNLNLVDTFVGEEIDIVFGWEELTHWELEIDLGYFEPGDAFLGPTDPAAMLRAKLKYVF